MTHDDVIASRIAAQRARAAEHLATTSCASVALASREAWEDAALEVAARAELRRRQKALSRQTEAWRAANAARAREEATEHAARVYVDALRVKAEVERERAAREERIERRARRKRAEAATRARERDDELARRFGRASMDVIEMFQVCVCVCVRVLACARAQYACVMFFRVTVGV